jgi:hypothetical protein
MACEHGEGWYEHNAREQAVPNGARFDESCRVGSGIKQTNRRVKGSEKQWLHAEDTLAQRCTALSEDGS